jgi:hypothetical protein
MKQTIKGTLFIIELNELDSSFISQIVYDGKTEILSVVLKNENVYNYEKVPLEIFVEFSSSNSFGSFYNENIKNKFKHLNLKNMAKEENGNKKNQPNRINKAGDFKRYIKMSIDVKKLNKDWFFVSRDKETDEVKAVYLKMTLCMQPDGEVDKYGQLGFIVQDVPQEISKAEKDLPKNERSKGEILGNAEELEWVRAEEKTELVNSDDEDIMEGLPF